MADGHVRIASVSPVSPISRQVRFGYGLGSFCTGTFSTVPGLLLLFYLTNVLDVSSAIAGPAVFVPKVCDLVINPIVGRFSDATRSKRGPRRPWLLAGALTLPVCFALIFIGPPLTGASAGLFVGGAFLLASTAYALFEVPYKAMPPEMTNDYHEQSSLLTWRMSFLGLAILLSGVVAPLIANSQNESGTVGGYRIMGIVIGVVLFVALLATFFGTRKAPHIPRGGTATSLRQQLAAARDNHSFLRLLGLSCAQMLAAGTMLAGAPYFATYILEEPDAVTTLFLALVGPIVITMPVWVRISRRFDKRVAMVLASSLFLVGGFSLTFTPLLGAVYAHICVVVVGVGYAGLQLMQYSMLADNLIADALQSGGGRAGVFTGLWTAAETVVFALGALLLGWMLALSGFVSSEPDKPVAQPDSAIWTVLIGGTAVPAVFVAIAILLTRRYDLTAERLDELRRLSQRAETLQET